MSPSYNQLTFEGLGNIELMLLVEKAKKAGYDENKDLIVAIKSELVRRNVDSGYLLQLNYFFYKRIIERII
jgi:hypothetical protein